MARKHVLGRNDSEAKKQFKINPRLQRTQASGNRKGLTLGSNIVNYKTVQNGEVVLPNRAVPQNQFFKTLRKVPENIINAFGVPTVKSNGGFE
ncbi:hypothetical protein ES702_02798 [subsurface metagenome]